MLCFRALPGTPLMGFTNTGLSYLDLGVKLTHLVIDGTGCITYSSYPDAF